MVSFTSSSNMLLLAALLAVAPSALAQTFTDCNPLNKTNCPDMLALGTKNYTMNFQDNTPSGDVWNTTAGKIDYADDGAEFTINAKGDSPTIKSNFYFFFGTVEVIAKAATGQGIVSSIVLQSEDLDEVDWEWIGGNQTYVETNYFGKGGDGDPDAFKHAIWHPVDNPMTDFHNYTVDWQKEQMDWYVDGQKIRTLTYDEASNGTRYPQTPMNVRLGIWAGGDPSQPKGTIEWAGGETNYDDVPYTMTVKSLRVSDASNATTYRWGDQTGTWESIKLMHFSKDATSDSSSGDSSDSSNTTTTKPLSLDGSNSQSASQSAEEKFNSLTKTQKIAIGGSVVGVSALLICLFAFCCIKQRRLGKKERELADQEYEKQTAELLAYRAELNRTRSEQMQMGGGAPRGGMGGRMKRLSQSLGISKGPGYHVI